MSFFFGFSSYSRIVNADLFYYDVNGECLEESDIILEAFEYDENTKTLDKELISERLRELSECEELPEFKGNLLDAGGYIKVIVNEEGYEDSFLVLPLEKDNQAVSSETESEPNTPSEKLVSFDEWASKRTPKPNKYDSIHYRYRN